MYVHILTIKIKNTVKTNYKLHCLPILAVLRSLAYIVYIHINDKIQYCKIKCFPCHDKIVQSKYLDLGQYRCYKSDNP